MALQPIRGGIDIYWSVTNQMDDSIYISGNYGERFNMSKHRFKFIRRCMRFAVTPGATQRPVGDVPLMERGDIDPWEPIRPFVDAFNANRAKSVTPGRVLTVDEVMSMWLGLDGDYAVEGLPHVTKIARKPRRVGTEMKACADGESGIMMNLQIMEGKERESFKKLNAQHGFGCAVYMRCIENWYGTGRHTIGDSAFGSSKTNIAVHKEVGMYSSL